LLVDIEIEELLGFGDEAWTDLEGLLRVKF